MHNTLRSFPSHLSALARSHDDLPAFNAAYWILTLLAAMIFNAGAFLVLIAGHMVLDVYKYREIHGKQWKKVAEGVARENLIDVSVIALGIAFSVYCHTALPLFAGIQGLIRTEIAIVNGLVQVVVKTHVLHGVLTILANLHQYLRVVHPRFGKKFSTVEIVAVASLVVSIALTVVSPWILQLDADLVVRMAADIFVPWNL